MTMSKNDYDRITRHLAHQRTESLANYTDTDDKNIVNDIFADLSFRMARAFVAVNPRFKYDTFFNAILDADDAKDMTADLKDTLNKEN